MSQTLTLPQFAGLMAHLSNTMPTARRHALDHAGQVVEDEAKRLIGTYDADPRWPELAEATKADRRHQGFPENEPLLRTGELRDSIEHKVEGSSAVHVGSDNDKAVWQELGTQTIPPRSFLKSAVVSKAHDIERAIGHTIHAHLSSGSFPSSSGHSFNVHDEKIK